MPTQVDLQGNVGGGSASGSRQRPGTVVLPTSSGGLIAVVVDANRSTSSDSYGARNDIARIEVWYSADKVTFSRVANITPTTAISGPYIYAADLFNDNSVGIAWVTASGIRYRKVTTGTWTIGAEETVSTQPANSQFEAIDLSISDSDSVLIMGGLSYSSGSTRQAFRLFGKSLTGAWGLIGSQVNMSSTEHRNHAMAVAVAWAKGTLATGRRAYMLIYGSASTNADQGWYAWCDSSTETTGAALQTNTRTQVFSQVGRGYMSEAGGWTTHVRKANVAATEENNTFLFGMVSAYTRPAMYYGKISFDGTTVTTVIPLETHERGNGRAVQNITTCAITIGKNSINFFVNNYDRKDVRPLPGVPEASEVAQPKNWPVSINDAGNQFIWHGWHYYNNDHRKNYHAFLLFGGGGKNARSWTAHDMLYSKEGTGGIQAGSILFHEDAAIPLAPYIQTPSTGSTVSTSTPAITSSAKIERTWPQFPYRILFEFATDALFTTNRRQYLQPESKFVRVFNSLAYLHGIRISDVLPQAYELTQTSGWYMRTAVIDAFGNIGPWKTNTGTFTVSHPPSPAEIEPSGGQVVTYGAGQVMFNWEFTDPSPNDFQTAFQVVVEDNDTGAIVYDSGRLNSGATSHIGTIPSSGKNKTLRWTVRLYDKDGVVGDYADYQTFYLADNPDVSITSPTAGGTSSSGVPTVTFVPTVGGGREITRYRITWTRNGVPVFNSGDIIPEDPIVSGTTVTYAAEDPALTNNTNYTVQVVVTDSLGVEGSSPLRTFRTSFVVPAAPQGVGISTVQYGVEGGGYVSVSWNDTGRDVDFQAWAVVRRDDLVDAWGDVLEVGTPRVVGYVFETSSSGYTYRDYYAPSGYRTNYLVKQVVNRYGDVVESNNEAYVWALPQSEGYWLIEATESGEAGDVILLYNVTQDDYTTDYEEAEYTIIGRGRRVDRGSRLGRKGTMTAQIRDSAGTSARQRKQHLESLTERNVSLFVRNPFGDVLKVYVGAIQVSRVAGVGRSEFVDVSFPYTEVY